MRRIILVLLISVPLLGQDAQPRAWQADDIYSEIGKLHVQVAQLNEYVAALKAQVKQLQDENAKLKEKAGGN